MSETEFPAMNNPLVSVIIPCYNAEKYVGETIRNALDQTYSNCEVIVIDDGSTDGSLEVVKSYGDELRWETGPNRGGCAARNRGIELANGEWIQFLDADDKLSKKKIEKQLMALGRSTETKLLAVCPWRHFDENKEGPLFDIEPYKSTSLGVDILVEMWSREDMFPPHCFLVSKSLMEAVGPWDEMLTADQDGEFFGRVLCAAERVVIIDDEEALYRRPGPGHVSSRKNKESMLSRLNSWKSVQSKLIKKRDNKCVRRVVLSRLRSVAYLSRDFPDIIQLAHEAEKRIGFTGLYLEAKSIYSLLSSVLGLRIALKIRSLFKE